MAMFYSSETHSETPKVSDAKPWVTSPKVQPDVILGSSWVCENVWKLYRYTHPKGNVNVYYIFLYQYIYIYQYMYNNYMMMNQWF